MIDTIASIKENKFLLGTDSVTRNYARTDDVKTFLNNLRSVKKKLRKYFFINKNIQHLKNIFKN